MVFHAISSLESMLKIIDPIYRVSRKRMVFRENWRILRTESQKLWIFWSIMFDGRPLPVMPAVRHLDAEILIPRCHHDDIVYFQ